MRTTFRTVVAIAVLAAAGAAQAALVGQQVSGVLNFYTSTNFFDPANGQVPAGFLNTAGPTVTIGDPDVEFGFSDGSNQDIADFTNTQLIITDQVFATRTQENASFRMSFTSATAGLFLTLSEVSDSFSNGGITASLVGNVIELTWAGGDVEPGTMRAVFDITTGGSVVPEPATLALVGLALLGAVAVRRRG